MPTKLHKELCLFKEELGFVNEKELIKKALEDKILEWKGRNFFDISDRIREGLKKRGVSPVSLLKSFKS